ncbi:hypothetical protein AUK40_06645 [Candidatus Wirthbacteria bacterium CG2_30_54_11]|uniref:Prepilin-type N-terminal cleavage/methylation domain-containing protein n=1 Tax=Candidatus Wirthbacteria bacterium CG2_30_54_11 TaxID=1817892 RepID=A0A1J5IC79_9BACT|nr:MAG: hypothetical protein AUK40_06645 [Candidatus Wirthbacteria bacterium CG2_30_54_11]
MRTHLSAFTLIETLIAIAIFGILAMVAVKVFFTITKNQTKSNTTSETYTQAQMIMSEFTDSIHQARSVYPDYTTGSQLALRMNDYSIIIYTIGSSQELLLQHETPSDPNPTTLTSDTVKIDHLAFTVTDPLGTKPAAVTIELTVSSAQNSGSKPQLKASTDLQSTIVLRSY